MKKNNINKSISTLTFSYMSQNGQIHFKHPAANAAKIFKVYLTIFGLMN